VLTVLIVFVVGAVVASGILAARSAAWASGIGTAAAVLTVLTPALITLRRRRH